MERAVCVGLLCVVLVFRLTTGNPVFYQRPTVMNKVEFSDRDIDADRIDPLIEQSEEEDGRSNEAVNTRTDMDGVGENGVSKDITTVTEITRNEPTEALTTGQYTEPTEHQQQHTGNETKDKNSTETELGGEMTTAAVIPSDETPPDLKPTVPSLYGNDTKDIDNSESNLVEESSHVSTSDAEATTKPVSSESSATMTQTAFPTERQSETSQSVTTAVSETITNALELTSSLIVPAITDWFRAYASSDVPDSTEEVTRASSSSPSEEPISSVELKEQGTSSSLTGTEEISLASIDSNAIDTIDNKESSIEVTTKDSKATFSSSTVGIKDTDEPEETLLETTTAILTKVTESEISKTTIITPTFTVVETSDREEESATEPSTHQLDMTTRMLNAEYIPTTTESYITSDTNVNDTDPPLTESETIEAATTTSVTFTTTGEAQEGNIDDTTHISSTESIESTTDIAEDIVAKDYTTATVESETSTSTLLVTIQPESSVFSEGETDSLTSTTDTPRLTTTEVPNGIDTTVLIPESSTSILYEAEEDSSTAPVTESPTTFQLTDMLEENDSHTTSKYSNTDSMESADETSARSKNGSNQQDTSDEDQYSTLESFTLATEIATATFAQSSSEIVTLPEDQQSTTWASSSILAVETAEATTFASSMYSNTNAVTLPQDEYTTMKVEQSIDTAEDPDNSTLRPATSSQDLDLTTASLFKPATDIATTALPISTEEHYTTLVSSADTVDSTTLIESKYEDEDSSKSTEDQDLTVTAKYDTNTIKPKTEENIEITTFTNTPIEITTSTEPDELKTSTLLASIENATDGTTTISVTQGATTFTSSSEEVDTVKATLASDSITTSMSGIAEDVATVATEEITTGMDLIEDSESTTTFPFPSTVVSTLNLSEPRTTSKSTLPTEDDSELYTTIDNENLNKIATVSSYDENIRTEETTTILPYTTVPTSYVDTVDSIEVSTENMPRKVTSGQTNPASTDTPEEIPNTEENITNTSQETSSTSKEAVSFRSISISDEEAEHEINLNNATSPIESVSDYVTEQEVMESTLDKSTEDLENIDETDATLKIRSSGSNTLPRTTLPSITLATSTALPENASIANDPTTALNMYSHSIASVETVDPSTSMSVNEEDYPSTSFSLLTPENGAASLQTTTILCFVATLTVLTISDNLRLHRRH